MKLRESGMPEEAYWETLFDVGLILDRLGIDAQLKNVVELGCGYGHLRQAKIWRAIGAAAFFGSDTELACSCLRLATSFLPPF